MKNKYIEQLKKLNEELENMSEEEMQKLLQDIDFEDDNEWAELERYVMNETEDNEES